MGTNDFVACLIGAFDCGALEVGIVRAIVCLGLDLAPNAYKVFGPEVGLIVPGVIFPGV